MRKTYKCEGCSGMCIKSYENYRERGLYCSKPECEFHEVHNIELVEKTPDYTAMAEHEQEGLFWNIGNGRSMRGFIMGYEGDSSFGKFHNGLDGYWYFHFTPIATTELDPFTLTYDEEGEK